MADKRVKIHLGVTRDLQTKLQSGGEEAISKLAERLHLSQVRDDRLSRFGILTAEANASAIEALREEPGVEFVEEDKQQKAI